MREQPLLRTRLLTWLLVPLTVLLTVDTFVSYWVALKFSQRAYDRVLVEIARELSLHLRADAGGLALELPEQVRRVLLSDPADRIYFEIADAGGRAIAGEPVPPPPPGAAGERLYDGVMMGEPVRIVALRVGADPATGRAAGVEVRVAETEQKRNGLAREILLSVVLPQILLILIAGIVVWLGVLRGLASLRPLQRAVAMRSHRDRSPVALDKVPGEVTPLLQAINELLTRLDRAMTLQSRFISDAAHQLKTPIAVLRAQLELAMREGEPQRMRQALEKSLPGLERLSRVVSQLLSLARNEPEAAAATVLVAVDLGALALDAATAWVPEALKRGIDLGFEGPGAGDGPVRILGDAERLRELLDNLIDNAVRYSRPNGRVTVRLICGPAPAIEISDDGERIPQGERERVFERFHRLLGNAQAGSGLGLAIAQEIARIHGARISLRDDTDGVGNTFAVTFPEPSAG
jgi:two-component system sensor histidine kinase TctE